MSEDTKTTTEGGVKAAITDDTAQEQQLERLKLAATATGEKRNEFQYRAYFVDLLKRHRHSIVTTPSNETETALLRRALSTERNALLGGAITGLAVFVSLRYLPALLIPLLGGKSRALQEARELAKKEKYYFLRRTGEFLLEGTLSFGAAYRGYHMTLSSSSSRLDDFYQEMADTPLCSGRSAISDALCSEWIHLVYNRIPCTFWENLTTRTDDERLVEEKTWRAVLKFAENCQKRQALETIVKKRRRGIIAAEEPVDVPTPGVPENILTLSEEEAESLVSD